MGHAKPKPLKIHIERMGGVRVDPKEFFAQPKVKETIKKMKKMDIVGKKLDDKTLFPRKPAKNSK